MDELRYHLKRRSRHTARKRVGEIDGDTDCVVCGSSNGIEVHHIDGDWLNNHPINLAPVCHRCHKSTHQAESTHKRVKDMRNELEEITA